MELKVAWYKIKVFSLTDSRKVIIDSLKTNTVGNFLYNLGKRVRCRCGDLKPKMFFKHKVPCHEH